MKTLPSLQRMAAGALLALAGLGSATVHAEDEPAAREIEIVVRNGYHPSVVHVQAGERVRLKFVRREYTACTREVVFPTLGIRRELPPNVPVAIELPELSPGEVPFHCGMKMVRGMVHVGAGR